MYEGLPVRAHAYANTERTVTNEELRIWTKERLRILREDTGLTIEEFAKQAKIDKRTIYTTEDSGNPTVETLNQWLQACKSDVSQFFEPLRTSGWLQPAWTKWVDRLISILKCDDGTPEGEFIAHGIQLNLTAVEKEARLYKRAKIASGKPPPAKRQRA